VKDLPFIASLQLGAILLYVIPRTSVLGAVLLTVLPLTTAMLAWLGLYLRENRIRELLPLLKGEGGPRQRAG
jgi:hypothetical protein